MKNLITLLFVVVSISLLAQSPQKFNYQAVVRNADGTVIKNQSVNFRMTIFEGSTTGLIKYQETQAGTTNKYGLISLAIGNGIISAGSMASINWGGNGHLLQVEIDPAGGTNFNILSTSQLMSVPYALYALSSGNGSSGGSDNDADSTNEIQTVSISNDTVFLSRGGFVVLPPGSSGINNDNDSTNEIQTVSISNDTVFLSRGGFAILPPGGGINNDNDSTNEIQTVSISNDTVFLSKGGFAILPPGGGINNDNDSTNEIQALTISNDTIYLARGGFVKLPATSGSVNNDNDSTNELIQTIIISNDSIVITEPNSINKLDISAYNQTGAVAGLNARIINDSLRLNGVNSSVTGFDSRITNDSVRLNGLESDVDTRIVNDSIRLNGVATNQAGFDTRITNDSVRLNGLESDVDTRIVNDSIRLNGVATNQAGFDTRITNDSVRLNGLESDVDTRIVNDSIRLNGVATNQAGFDTRITNDSVRLNGLESDVDTRIVNDSIRLNGVATNQAGFDTRITNDSVRLNGLESDVDTRIVNDSIRLNGVATNQAGFDTRITNDSVRLNGLESDVDTRIVNDSIRLNGSISKAVSDSNVIHSALSDTASAIRSDIKWQTNGTAINFMTGNVGIGVLAPVIKLDVSSGTTNNAIRGTANGTGENTAIFGNTPTTTGNNNRQYGIQGRAGSAAGVSGSGGHFGVHGEAYGAGNVSVGVSGYSAGKSTTGSSRGLSGFSESNVAVNNQGVFATARGSIGGSGHNAGLVTDVRGHSVTNYGVLNLTQANGTNNYGTANFSYWFLAGAAGTRNYGSYNWVSSADTNIGVFVDATITPADVNYGVWSKASGTNSLAGFFEGDVTITGDLDISGAISKGSGTFKIDHPLDPENKYLVHSFVESPDMMNVYNGNATTDANGIAIIELPQYIEASNKDFRYQLTPIGKFAQCIVKEEVKGDKFIIQTDKPNVKVSWQVTGIRNDPYAKQNRVIAEEEKSPRDKGSYLHPEVYGLDKSRSVHPKTKSKSKEEVLEMEKSK